MDFLFYSVYDINCTDQYSNGKSTSQSWDKIISCIVLAFLYVTGFDMLIFFTEFISIFIKDIGIEFYCLIISLKGLRIRIMLASKKQNNTKSYEAFPLTILCKSLYRITSISF